MTAERVEAIVGRVLRASTRGFDCGTHSRNIGPQHDFGAFIKAPIANDDDVYAIALIYKIEIKDDQLISELVLGDEISDNILRDQRMNRMIPVEIKAINIAYMTDGQIVHSLPPRPPMSLSDVTLCNWRETYEITQQLTFFRLVLNASEVPGDDLVAAAARRAAFMAYHDEDERYAFMVRAGQQIARDLASDLKRLSHILTLMQQV